MNKPFLKFSLAFVTSLFFMNKAAAAGLQLFEQSVAYLGNAFAGTAAAVDDASSAYYNPAAMTLYKVPEISAGLTALDINLDTHIQSSTSNSIIGLPFDLPPVPVTGKDRLDAGSWNFVPALNFVFPFHHCVALGLSISAPFGLNTAYDGDSKVRYITTLSKLAVIDVGPSLALQIAPQLSIGAGFDIQYAKVKAFQKLPVGESLPPIPFGGPYPDGEFKNVLNDIGYGWNAAVLYEIACGSRVGLSYRSRVRHHLQGDAFVDVPPPLSSLPGDVRIDVSLPETANLSLYHDINCQWAVLASVNYTHWSLLDEVVLKYSGPITFDLEKDEIILKWQDAYRYALAVNYSPTCRWKLRAGVAYDQSPVRSADTRIFRVPDSDRYWVALGAQYKMSKCLLVDVGYSHLFVERSSSNQIETITLTNGSELIETVRGTFTPSVNEIGLQLTWQFI